MRMPSILYHTLYPCTLSLLLLSLFLTLSCKSQNLQTDTRDCNEIQIRNANLHPALSGFYQRTQETYSNMPVFEGRTDNTVRYIWWNQYDGFSRWAIGTDKFSTSIEGFMDNQLNEAWLLGNGRSWHVVNQQEWKVDQDMNIVCSRYKYAQNDEGAADAKAPPPRGGRAPPQRNQQSQQVILVSGARNNALNQAYYETNEKYDGYTVYKTDTTEKPIYLFHYSYDNMQRWYIGNTLGTDYDVLAFIEDVTHDFSKDGTTQLWTEHSSTNGGQWIDNNNFKAALQANQYAHNADTKRPPQERDYPQSNQQQQQQQQQYQQEERYDPPPRDRDRDRGRGRNRDRDRDRDQSSRDGDRDTDSRDRDRNDRDRNRDRDRDRDSRDRGRDRDRDRSRDRRNQQQQDQQQQSGSDDYRKDRRSAEEDRNERRRQMFRRVNKLDLDVEDSGKFESGVDTKNEPDIIVTGSDDPDINTVYFVQPVRYNEHAVYKSQAGSYLYFVRYAESDAARWQIGQPNGGVKNDQPIAFVNADSEYPYDIATWQAWLVYDKMEHDWVRQAKVNTYRGDCVVNIEGSLNRDLNGEWGILPMTHEARPVFERVSNSGRITIFYVDGDAQYSKWCISQPGAKSFDPNDIVAFIPSSALTVDGVSDFETWQENQNGRLVENGDFKISGTCSKVKEHDWKRRRRQRAEERKRRKAMDAAKQQHCPSDMEVSADPGRDTAVVHWQAYNPEALEDDENDYDIVYSDSSVAPGSEFKLGRTAVTYELRDKQGSVVAKCDFIITVRDEQAPDIQCPGDIYIMTEYNKDRATVKWIQPEVFDNSGSEIQLQQTGGPHQGETLRIGQYMVSYEAKDTFGNAAVCNFGLFVVDRQAPKIQNCPQSIQIPVYKDQGYAAYPDWDVPTAWDNVDGNDVKVNLIQGVQPGSKLVIPPGNKNEIVTQIVYEASDSSDNAARCSFEVKLYRDESDSEKNKQHQEYHKKIQETQTIEQSEDEYKQNLQDNEEKQDAEWSEKARRLREERELQNRQRRAQAANGNKPRGHRSATHQEHVRSQTHDFEESLRLEDELRDQTNDEVSASVNSDDSGKSTKKKPMTRAERRAKRREDRARRRKEREERKKKKAEKSSGSGVMGIIFWGTLGFFWTLMRPWTWPLYLSIPFLVMTMVAIGVGVYFVYSEVADHSRRGRRVPKYNSWSYKLSNVFNRKTAKQRV